MVQIKEPAPIILCKEVTTKAKESESQGWGNSTKMTVPTKQATRDKVQTISNPINVLMQGSDNILGSSIKARFQGIVSDFVNSQQDASLNKTSALYLAGGVFPWN
ncbi:hypothetical protein V6N12_065342 [Hibiscus sabdariffa]|uniref:Uncharacterized protein n=1 Tax=Hibiscus sabdariffa TaxID=183260 RepID=A0ABR2G8M6_9ROSI